MLKIFANIMLVTILFSSTELKEEENTDRAKQTLDLVLKYYDAGHDHLFLETWPYKADGKVTYLAGEDTVKGKRVAYLWPTSGFFSAVNALLKATGDREYSSLLESTVLPGLGNYYDADRKPSSYQSYIKEAGLSDRFYDDNIWLGIDFLEAFELTRNEKFLSKSKEIWEFVISGWDEKAGGGIYWCEQKKKSKNTCSNAPAAVLALKLFHATNEKDYLLWGEKIYNWTKSTLQDPKDHLYFDNIKLNGEIDHRKYTYNSGQMLQAAVLLYIATRKEAFLADARAVAQSAIRYFTEDFETPNGKKIKLFKNTGNWFNAILMRGYSELYKVDKNPEYINVFQDNVDHLWTSVRSSNGLFSKDWKGEKEDQYKWLLDQVSLVEIWANLEELKKE